LADLGDAGEAVGYVAGFWAFLFSPRQRAEVLRHWRAANGAERGLMLLDGAVATVIGLGLPVLVAWVIMRWVAD
jgi:hypothetical protein